jgi:hypothetical protein
VSDLLALEVAAGTGQMISAKGIYRQSLAQTVHTKVVGTGGGVERTFCLLSGSTVPNVKKILVRRGWHILAKLAGCPI